MVALLASVAVVYMMLVGVARLVLVRGNVEAKIAIVVFALSSLGGSRGSINWARDHLPGGYPLLVEIGQCVSLLATAMVVGAFVAGIEEPGRLWLGRPTGYWRRLGPVLALSVCGCVALLILSASARRQGLVFDALPGWRAGAHALVFWLVPSACVAVVVRPLVQRHRRLTTRMDRAFSWLVLFAIAASFVDRAVVCIGIAIFAAGARSLAGWLITVDSLILWIDVAAVTALLPSVVWAVLGLLGMDTDSRAIRRMLPVWSDLSAAVPGVVCAPLLGRGNARSERSTRLRVEIRDAVTVVSRFVEPLPLAVEELVEDIEDDTEAEDMRAVAELVSAVRRIRAAGGIDELDPIQSWSVEPQVDLVVRLWGPAARLLDAAGSEQPVRTRRAGIR